MYIKKYFLPNIPDILNAEICAETGCPSAYSIDTYIVLTVQLLK